MRSSPEGYVPSLSTVASPHRVAGSKQNQLKPDQKPLASNPNLRKNLYVIDAANDNHGLKTGLFTFDYFPKGTDLSVRSQAQRNKVARQLNERPRKTLGIETKAERFNDCVASTS